MHKSLVSTLLAAVVLGAVTSVQADSDAAIKTVAVAAVSGAGKQSLSIARALSLHLEHAGIHATPLEAARSCKGVRGIRTTKRVPVASDDSTSMEPLWAVTIWCVM